MYDEKRCYCLRAVLYAQSDLNLNSSPEERAPSVSKTLESKNIWVATVVSHDSRFLYKGDFMIVDILNRQVDTDRIST